MSEIFYEVINLETGAVSPVIDMLIGNTEDQWTDVTFIEGGLDLKVRFSNEGNQGNLLNEKYAIRQVGTQLTPNSDGVVTDEGTEVAISQETRADIQEGTVNPDTIGSQN